ncbi:anti-sigma factor [Rheinheimera sp. SA_1]|uniref:Rsd/AlgQ family anti-sigma factor n=1 Tax=Rheinheimera sp. SA_1 TaxID=1827365 RepID=UPI0007FDF806|nr:Rsd/AlgQ family anti-sigma factor [Rheinheimera sp. SA_1]OBP13285.1 anti-sigma factor [Rheinheimera sp. SA_1]
MYTRLQSARQQWGGSSTAIDNWLEDRQQLIVSYCKLAALPPFDKQNQDNQLPAQEDILCFCQLLMDYLSAGHFEVYDQIVSQCEINGNDSKSLAEALYPKISASTDIALEFNDNYAEPSAENSFSTFDHDLSALGQALEDRFGLEDELIQTLFANHVTVSA